MSAFNGGAGDRLTQEWANDLCAKASTESEIVRASVVSDEPTLLWPPTVVSVEVGEVPGEYGPMMPAWPVTRGGLHQVRCLSEWGGYLSLLGETYAPHSEKATAILNTPQGRRDRIAVGVMNDVLQVQMPSVPAKRYSMIRHHALMLLAATEWLPAERPAVWRVAYGELADVVFGSTRIGLASWKGVIAEAETEGLAALKASAKAGSNKLGKQAMMRYLLLAGAAVGVLYRRIDKEEWTWHEAIVPLARAYRSDQCLLDK